jgi:CheY-like chemotaxis protein
MKILIADDDVRIRDLLRDLVAPLGHEVLEASDAPGAMAAIEAHHPRLMFVDVRMPGAGVHGIRRLAAIDPSARCIVITGEAGETAERILRNLGMVVLLKPLQLPDVVALVRGAEQASEGPAAGGATKRVPYSEAGPPPKEDAR